MPTFVSHVEFSTKLRAKLAEEGEAMPGGSFPIRNRADLKRAIQAFGRAKNKVAAKRWIIKRARELNAIDLLPDSWVSNLTHDDMMVSNRTKLIINDVDYVKHYGVRGQKWGVRRINKQLKGLPPGYNKHIYPEMLRDQRAIGSATAGIGAAYMAYKIRGGSGTPLLVGATTSAATYALIRRHQSKKISVIKEDEKRFREYKKSLLAEGR